MAHLPATNHHKGALFQGYWKGIPAPRPLYSLHDLADRPDAPAADKADLSPFNGRTVYIWPDNDEQRAAYAERVAVLAHEAGAESVKVLRLDRLPEQLPPKGNAADVAGWTPDTGAALLADVNAWQEIQKPSEQTPALSARFTLNADGVYYQGTSNDGEALPPAWICSLLHITAMTRTAHVPDV